MKNICWGTSYTSTSQVYQRDLNNILTIQKKGPFHFFSYFNVQNNLFVKTQDCPINYKFKSYSHHLVRNIYRIRKRNTSSQNTCPQQFYKPTQNNPTSIERPIPRLTLGIHFPLLSNALLHSFILVITQMFKILTQM